MDHKDLADKLKSLRSMRGLTQDELADKAGVAYSTLAKLEQGQIKNPSFLTILALTEALMVSMDELLTGTRKHAQKRSRDLIDGIKAVYFDVHGVLVQDWPTVFGRLSEDLDIEPYKVEDRFWTYDQEVTSGQMTLHDFEQAMARDLGVHHRQIEYLEHYLESCETHQPAFDLINTLKASGIKVGILTNIFPGFLDELIKAKTIPLARTEFDYIVESWEIKSYKPQPEIFSAAEQAADTTPKRLLLVDDSPVNVDAAQSRNWHGLVYDQNRPQEGSDRIHEILANAD